jgi:hypothetical protein
MPQRRTVRELRSITSAIAWARTPLRGAPSEKVPRVLSFPLPGSRILIPRPQLIELF